MRQSWKLGTAFGIGLYVHWTFLLLLPYVSVMVWESDKPPTANLAVIALAVPLIICVFGCVLLHELGHALAARACGIGTRDITLYPIGGVARLERMSERPEQEIFIAVAGPAVNLVIAGLLISVLVLISGMSLGTGLAQNLEQVSKHPVVIVLVVLAVANLMLLAFNMLPCFPMDGGRVLRALLALVFGHLKATEVAAGLGIVVAMMLGLLPVIGHVFDLPLPRNPMLILVAAFVFFAGQQELAMVRRRAAARLYAEVLPAPPAPQQEILEGPEVISQPGFSGFTWDGKARHWIVWQDGQPVATFAARPD